MVLLRVNGALLRVVLQDLLLLRHSRRVSAQRGHVGIPIVHVGVVRHEAALIAVDVRVSASAIDMVVDSFARAALAASSRNMLRAHRRIFLSESAASHGTRWVVHVGEASAILADVGVSTSAVGVVYFGATCAC